MHWIWSFPHLRNLLHEYFASFEQRQFGHHGANGGLSYIIRFGAMGKYAQNILMSVQSKYSLYRCFWLKIFPRDSKITSFCFDFCPTLFQILCENILILVQDSGSGRVTRTYGGDWTQCGTTMGSTLRTLDNAPLVVLIFSKRQKTSHPCCALCLCTLYTLQAGKT